MSAPKSTLRILLINKLKHFRQNVLRFRLLLEKIALRSRRKKLHFPWCSRSGRKWDSSETLPVIAYRPEVGTLVLFPILHGKNGGPSLQDSISGPQSFTIRTRRVSSRHLQGLDMLGAYWEATQALHFSRLGLRWGTKRVRWNAVEAMGLRLLSHPPGLGGKGSSGIRSRLVEPQSPGRRCALRNPEPGFQKAPLSLSQPRWDFGLRPSATFPSLVYDRKSPLGLFPSDLSSG